LDEVFVKVNGKLCYLWRAVDHEGEVLEAVVTARRDKAAALKLLKRIMKKYGAARSVVTDRLRAYSVAMKEISAADRQVGGRLNNRAENSHQPFRRRERAMQRFRSMKTLQKFSSVHAQVHNQFNQERHLFTRQVHKQKTLDRIDGVARPCRVKGPLASGRVALRVGECGYSDDACAGAGAFGPHRLFQARACEVFVGPRGPLVDHRAQKTRWSAGDLGKPDPRPRGVFGIRLPRALAAAFIDKALRASEGIAGLSAAMRGLIAARTAVMTAVAAIDADMRRMTRASAAWRRLMAIPGVGQLTALAFVAAIDDPSRIRRSRVPRHAEVHFPI
jgi:IS1 family transposase